MILTIRQRAKLVKRRRACLDAAMKFRQQLAEAELWKTYQAMDAVIKAIGWEIAGHDPDPGLTVVRKSAR